MYPNAPTKCKSFLRTNWLKDKHSQMSYSFVAPGGSPRDYETLAESVGCLHFAGEHTHFEFLGCTQAAYLSGVRAAKAVVSKPTSVQVRKASKRIIRDGKKTTIPKGPHGI
jgi:monoamine oxidase